MARTIIVISDRVDWSDDHADAQDAVSYDPEPADARRPPADIAGSYLERLPLAAIAAGAYDRAEIWHHCISREAEAVVCRDNGIVYRRFHLPDPSAPFDNRRMIERLQASASPALVLIYGLGVSPAVIAACGNALLVYNSIDAPALRVPPAVAGLFDLMLVGAAWQAEEIAAQHPGMATLELPVGPEFAATHQFYPDGSEKLYDLVYVGAAQPYKRHDILFDALAELGPDVSALCVFGYGELAEHYRAEAAERGLKVDFVMPPVRPYDQVNHFMNRARIGVVAGVDDGAPAILTEYMLAGLPVLANADLACGTAYITPETGLCAAAADFPAAIRTMLASLSHYRPRQTALARWSWPVSVARLLDTLALIAELKALPRGRFRFLRAPGPLYVRDRPCGAA